MPLDIGIKMDFPKTCKKSKMNGVRKDQEKLLISYSGEEKLSESDSDRVQPLELPPTRLRRPKSRKIRVSPSSKSMFSMWNFCQVVFVVVVIGAMVSMMWFTIILKTSLESMKKRISILETSDRSTSKECLKLGKDLEKKLEVLRGSSSSVLVKDEKNIHLLLKKIKVLNETVKYLKLKLKSPKSVSSINHDIDLLKKAMADTSGEMAEVTDKVNQLRKIAHLENGNIKHLKIQMYNVSVQIAKLSGQPTPRPQINTVTPPWLLRVPAADISSNAKTTLNIQEAENLRGNITSLVHKDINKLARFVIRANKTVQNQVHELNIKLSGLVINVSAQMALIHGLMKKTSKQNETSSIPTANVASIPVDILQQYKNLTKMVENLRNSFDEHYKRFQEMTSSIANINLTMHQLVTPSTTTCNCSLDGIWTAVSKDQKMIHSLKTGLELLKDSVQQIKTRDIGQEPTKASVLALKKETSKPTTKSIVSIFTRITPSRQQTVVQKNVSGTNSTLPEQSSNSTVTAPTSEKALKENRRMTDDEKTDLDTWEGDDEILKDSDF